MAYADIKTVLLMRRHWVESQMESWKNSQTCKDNPKCPYCVLKTELEIVNKYLEHLTTEEFYVS